MIADEICNERRRLSLAGVGGNDVNAVGSLIKSFTGFVDRFGFAFDSRAERSFNDITDDGARMTVRRRGLAGSVMDLNHSGLQVIAIQFRQSLRERDARSAYPEHRGCDPPRPALQPGRD
jgi:hypothetical protein